MKITNKALLASLALSFALVGCDNVVKNDNETPVKEESQDQASDQVQDQTEENQEDQASTEEVTTDDLTKTDTADSSEDESSEGQEEEATDDQSQEEEAADNQSESSGDLKADLEQAIFDNRAQVRAIELLFELTPDKVEDVRPQLEEMLENSNDLVYEAQQALDSLN